MKVRFLDPAEAELDAAVQWYAAAAPGLGNAFLIEVLSAAERVSHYPDAWQSIGDGVRRCRLNRFPYGLIYSTDKECVVVLAVSHLHRKPDHWRDRLNR